MEKLIDITSYPVKDMLAVLLQDKTTKGNIIWATDTYEELGMGYKDTDEINPSLLLHHPDIIKPRVAKDADTQLARTRKKAEVYSPAWLCCRMCNDLDEEWFGRKNVFNTLHKTHTWEVKEESIFFPEEKTWKEYVDSRRLEIACGEAPFLVSRYDAATGNLIKPLKRRVGLLDRKLRIVNENTETFDDWMMWTTRAFQSIYGFELQGDNLLIARTNLMLTFIEYYEDRWQKKPTEKEIKSIANIIAWNLWQMDAFKDTVPLGKPLGYEEVSLFAMPDNIEDSQERVAEYCKIWNWRSDRTIKFRDIKFKGMGDGGMKKKLFDFVIGNPPYQEDTDSESTRMPPIYDKFMDASFDVSNKTELIHPARFLFNAGYTPKMWNKKMLNDPHFKVLMYEPDSNKIFPNLSTPLKGGVAITYYDNQATYTPIGIFTKFNELNNILRKVQKTKPKSLESIISSPLSFKVSNLMIKENPDLVPRLRSSAFTKLDRIFYAEAPNDGNNYIGIIGLDKSKKRVKRYIRKDYIEDSKGLLNKYVVLMAKANGAGDFGEKLSDAIIAEPGVGYLQTFIGIGHFNDITEARNLEKYIKTKFLRAMLGILKTTQDCPGPKWAYVPLQDFSDKSDIDWSKSIPEIDQQLYKKYGLDDKEIAFIESHVKEMK